jgi:preprotein translocase subunit SecA
MVENTNIMDVASVEVPAEAEAALTGLAEHKANIEAIMGAGNIPTVQMRKHRPIVKDYKIRRNEPCPCGSGKKYKHCCLQSGKYETTHTI